MGLYLISTIHYDGVDEGVGFGRRISILNKLAFSDKSFSDAMQPMIGDFSKD